MNEERYNVVKILSEYSVVINAGINDFVKLGDYFHILDSEGDEVIDPITKEIIGTLDISKATVEVTELYESMCVCSSLVKKVRPNLSFNFDFEERERLNVDYSQITRGNKVSNKNIEIGDTAKLIKHKK